MILLSTPRPEPVVVLIVLPPGGRITARFTDDASVRDITAFAADLIAEYVLRAPAEADGADEDTVVVAEIHLEGCAPEALRFALIDTGSHAVGEVPADQFTLLLGRALAMAVTDAVDAAVDAATTPGGTAA